MLFIFDVGGVLTTTSKENDKIAKQVGLSLDEFKKVTDDLFEREDISSQEFWKLFNEKTGKNVQVDWLHLYFHPILNNETVALINELKAKGHRVVAGTNTCPSHYQNHIERGDYSFFDQTYASIFMGCHKPDKLFWEIILDAEGKYESNDCVFIDDKIENVNVAKSLGMHAIHFISADQVRKEINEILL